MLEAKNNHNTYVLVLCSLTREARSPFVLKHTTSYYFIIILLLLLFIIISCCLLLHIHKLMNLSVCLQIPALVCLMKILHLGSVRSPNYSRHFKPSSFEIQGNSPHWTTTSGSITRSLAYRIRSRRRGGSHSGS